MVQSPSDLSLTESSNSSQQSGNHKSGKNTQKSQTELNNYFVSPRMNKQEILTVSLICLINV